MIDQELRKAAECKSYYNEEDFIRGAQWEQQRSYSEEDMKKAFKVGFSVGYGSDTYATEEKDKTCEEWFERIKK